MQEKLDYFDPLFIAGFIMAGLSDFVFLFMIGLAIPVIGQVLAVGILGIHYVVGVFLFVSVLFRLEHFVPKLILGLAVLLPLPLMVTGLVLAIVAQNRLVELLLTQAALAVTTAGVGNVAAGVAEGANVAAKGAQAVGAATKGAEAAAGAIETTRGAQVAGGVTRAERLRRGAERGLRSHEKNLKQELGLDEKKEDSVTEENFGIIEPTDKSKELFNPEYNSENNDERPENKEGEGNDEIEARKKFEAQKQAGIEKRREGLADTPTTSGDEVELNQDGNEINLKKEA